MQKNYNTTVYREGLKQQTLVVAMSLFKRNGVKSVKMDDIATELGISKRTLYEMYSNKEDLLFECVKNDKQRCYQQLVEYSKTAANEMEIITYFFSIQINDLGTTNPVFFTDIIKYERIADYLKRNKAKLKRNSKAFIERGIEHGYFRDDVNYEILDRLGDVSMDNAMRTRLYSRYPLKEIFRTCMLIFTRTCCTPIGQQYMERVLANDNFE